MKRLLSIMLMAIGMVVSASASAQESNVAVEIQPNETCVTKAEMQLIAADFPQFRSLANSDYCYNGSNDSALIQTLMYMRNTAFDPKMNPSADELFTGRFAESWYQYFANLVGTLVVEKSCPKGVVAFVYGFGGDSMYACPLALTPTFSALDRASVFMHEARHLDGYPHITCSRGPRAGLQGACDRRISEGGSYAVTVETYAQLAKFATDIHPALKAYARASAVIYADEAFENPVKVNRTEKLLALSADSNFYTVDMTSGAAQKLGAANNQGRIVRRGQHLVMFPFDKTLPSGYVFSRNEGTIDQTAGELFTEYNNQTPEQRSLLKDIHIGAQWTARLYSGSVKLACDPRAETVRDLAFPNGQQAANLVYVNGYDRAASSALIQMVSGDLFEASCANKSASLKASSIKLDQKYKTIQKIGTKVVGLSLGNELYSLELAGNSARSQVINTDIGDIVEVVPWQTFEFFETP